MDDVQLDYRVPSPAVAPYVTVFYQFRCDRPSFDDIERADHAQLRFRLLPGTATYCFPGGAEQESTDSHIVGPTSGAIRSRAMGPVLMFGMGVTPAGWAAMMRSDASTMLNRMIDAETLLGVRRIRKANQALVDAATIDERVAIGEALVLELVASGDAGAAGFVATVDGWLAGSPSPEMDRLVTACGLSRRQVERKCKAFYGAPPKVLARKYRALRAAVALVTRDLTTDDLLDRGFYDQSHLIREVKQFTGLTPRQIKAEPTLLAQLTIGGRTQLEGRVGLLIADT